MATMTGSKSVDMKNIDNVENGRGAGAGTSVGRAVLSEQRLESRHHKWARGGGMESSVDEDPVVEGDAAATAPKNVARRAARKANPMAATGAPEITPGLSSSETPVLELEAELPEQKNRALTA